MMVWVSIPYIHMYLGPFGIMIGFGFFGDSIEQLCTDCKGYHSSSCKLIFCCPQLSRFAATQDSAHVISGILPVTLL